MIDDLHRLYHYEEDAFQLLSGAQIVAAICLLIAVSWAIWPLLTGAVGGCP